MRVIIESDYQALSQWAANYVASKINAANPTPENLCFRLSHRIFTARHVQSADRTEQAGKSIFPECRYFQYGRICRLA